MLKEGDKVPTITLPDNTGKKWKLGSAKAKYTVLYFYPKDDTPGCTIEAKEFSSNLSKFKKENVEVVGISGGDSDSKEKFCKKHKLSVKLLADESLAVSKKFGVYGKKQFLGKSYMGIYRQTFVINQKGKVVKIFPNVKPETHPEEVLLFIKDYESPQLRLPLSASNEKSKPKRKATAKNSKKAKSKKIKKKR